MSDELPAGEQPEGELPGLDLDRLRAHLDREVPGLVTGPHTGRVVAGGAPHRSRCRR